MEENNVMYDQLVERVLTERPDLAPYAAMFKQFNTNKDKESTGKYEEVELRLRKLSAAAKALQNDFDEAMDELDDLARALGACDICWGEDKRCQHCRGRGEAGHFDPDEKLFRSLILPAIKKISWLQVTEIK